MKILFILSLFSLSCTVENKTQNKKLLRVIDKTLKEPFFDNYKQNNLLYITSSFQKLLFLLDSAKNKKYFIVDSIPTGIEKYISIYELSQSKSFIRLQIGCYDYSKNFSIQYSTSFNLHKRKIKLYKEVSPYIDSMIVSK